MSRLEYYSRPLVAFDPSNKEHRRFYHEFIINNTWGLCPVRFICPSEHGMDLVKMIQTQMIEYYVNQEFKNDKKSKTRQKVRKILGLTNGGNGVILES
jgi:hypothetical protein